jgi:dipeptidyl aminopeptidase/acylaminoacyl peptidase
MRIRRLAGATGAAAILLVFVAPVRTDEPTGWTPELMLRVKRVGPVQVSPDGTRAAFVVGTAVMDGEKSEWLSHIHVATVDGKSSFQLTRGDKSATSPRWSPDGRWLAFVSPRSGRSNLWRIHVDGGEAEQVTDEKGGISQFRWSPDGRTIAFLMTDPTTDEEEKGGKEKRDARVVDQLYKFARLYTVPVERDASGKRPTRGLTKQDMHVTELQWAPDGRTIVFAHARTPKVFDQTDVSVVDVASGEVRSIAATGAYESDVSYSPDSQWIAFSKSDDPPTWAFLGHVNVVAASGGTPRALAPTFDEQPSILGWSADGRRLYVAETHGTLNRVSALPVAGGPPVLIGPDAVGVDSPALNDSRTAIGFTRQATDTAVEAYVTRLDRYEPAQVSRVQDLGAMPPLGRTEVITWKAADGQSVEGLLTYPADYKPDARVPLLVIVHGGPTGVFTQSFIGNPGAYPIAAFASRGYAVLRANVRGSSGYGRKWRYANYQDWGGGDYRDIMTGVDHLIAKGVADPERLGVMGWSYGGFMTSWVITQTKRFKAASVGAGVTNLMSFTGTSDIPGFVPDYFGGEFWDVFERWRAHSAMFNVKSASTPTLIQHGERDERVPIGQGYELYNALVRQKVPAKMVVYPRQPHGIQEPKLLEDAMKQNLEWFDRWILKKGTTTSER